MYGFVNSALEKLIKRRFGVEKWEEIRHFANVLLGDTDSFQVNHVYKDANTYTVVSAASEVLGLDAGTILEMFGEQFLLWCQESGYSKTLRLLGRSLQDFLTNLDALHDHLSIIYPQMDAPSFRCTGGFKKSEFLLHYYSDRDGLESIVMGIVKSVAREYYNTEVEMRLLVPKGPDSDHSIFSIREMAYHSATIAEGLAETEAINSFSDRQLISSETFCKAFPFHIIFDSKLRILQVGSSLSWVLPNLKLKESQLDHYFALERPRMKLYFDTILSHINTIFVLRMIQGSGGTTMAEKGSRTNRISVSLSSSKDPMRLRGQMIYAPESEAMLFLCSPRVKRLNDLEQRGLYLSDIPIHDATRGMLMMGQAAAAEFTKSVRLEELIIELKATQISLEEEKKRMSDLLHQMLPISVADSLMAGQMVEAERFESVTILFSDIVGFTSICGHSEPMQIVNMLNRLYSMFDQVVGQNQVYKVETIGDAYMVVGGLPERNNIHAECVANQALDMMHYCQQVKRPDNDENIVMRIGIHSGPVVAGIVGRRMPRYCLFGNTVNVASRTESNGTPGKIQVTEYTHKLLKDKPNFKFEFRERLQFKNVEDLVSCYYLLENTEKEDFTSVVVSDESEHVTYQFMMPRSPNDTPPQTPLPPTSPLPAGIGEILSHPSGLEFETPTPPRCPFSRFDSPYEEFSFPIPEFNVIHPTPGHTPNPTPPTSKRSSVTDLENQLRFSPHTSPPPNTDRGNSSSPEHDSDSEVGGIFMSARSNTPPLGRSLAGRSNRPPELDLPLHSTSPFMDTMRKVSLSPLREDMDEEELLRDTPTIDYIDKNSSLLSVNDGDEGIVMRKLSDVSIQSQESSGGLEMVAGGSSNGNSAKPTQRRISDTSNHSGESGIESSASTLKDQQDRDSGINCTMADSIRKCSASSNGSVEDELKELRRSRAGSVKGTIEIYNTLDRHRRTGLSTTAFMNGTDLHSHLKMPTSPTRQRTPPPSSNAAATTLRPARKSLDSVGSSGSND